MANKPINKWKSGNISGAIWTNEREVNGTKVEFKTASIKRSWKKEGDVWRDESINFRKQDIPKLFSILHEMQRELFLMDEVEENE
jgi:hypothetical protein